LKSKARAFCGYLFLSRQRNFYRDQWYYIPIDRLHDYAGLRPEGKDQYQIKREIVGMLDDLRDERVVTWDLNPRRRLVAIHRGKPKSKPDWTTMVRGIPVTNYESELY
jgi:hypothetical protein